LSDYAEATDLSVWPSFRRITRQLCKHFFCPSPKLGFKYGKLCVSGREHLNVAVFIRDD
jgi:hypothetical protein